jgi:hypothetical protein
MPRKLRFLSCYIADLYAADRDLFVGQLDRSGGQEVENLNVDCKSRYIAAGCSLSTAVHFSNAKSSS